MDTVLGLAIIYMTFNLALVVWTMRSFFAAVPRSLEEAAWIDGCGIWSGFLRIALPLAAPGLAATGILCFILSWNDFFFALILTRTRAMTAPVAIVNFMQYAGWEWGKIAAAGTLVMLPVLVFTFLVRVLSGARADGGRREGIEFHRKRRSLPLGQSDTGRRLPRRCAPRNDNTTYRSSKPRFRSASRIRSRPRNASASLTRLKHCCVQSIAFMPCSRWNSRIVAL